MSNDRKFFNFAFFKVDQKWRWLNDMAKEESAKEFIGIIDSDEHVKYRSYSTVGLREDADLLLWLMADKLDYTQDLIAKLNTTVLGKYLEQTYSFLSLTRPSVYSPSAIPSFLKGEEPLRYVIVYPFVKSREWYLLPFEERKKMMEEHTLVGKRFPNIKLNTTSSFGLDDQDFMLAFETNDLASFHDLVMQLRETQVSRYVVRDTPFIIGIYKPLEEIIKSLG
ncbi:MAG: chlorite dismutase [Candidatus Nitrosothermus koennekii]|nr:MAG: chlorite dismutase [Candidatus Nitrosothermus koennekii]